MLPNFTTIKETEDKNLIEFCVYLLLNEGEIGFEPEEYEQMLFEGFGRIVEKNEEGWILSQEEEIRYKRALRLANDDERVMNIQRKRLSNNHN